jgi:hypothetical protein
MTGHARLAIVVGIGIVLWSGCKHLPPLSPEQQQFRDRVEAYMNVHRKLAAHLPAGRDQTAEQLTSGQQALAQNIRAIRTDAQQGDVFTPSVGEDIRRRLREQFNRPGAANLRGVVMDSNPAGVRLAVNASYPAELPRSSVPMEVLSALPPLPPELEYRFVGRDLYLVDSRANLVVDRLPDAITKA